MCRELVFAVDKKSFRQADHIGVRNKVSAELKYFESIGFKCILDEYEWIGGYPDIHITGETSVLYFRTIEPSFKLFLKLRQLKKGAGKLRIIMEIPTFPFKFEQRDSIDIKRSINNLLGNMLNRFVIDRLVLIGLNHTIDYYRGIRIIHATNGIDIDNISVCTHEAKEDELNLIAVSGCYFWHGYERIIRGLANYYSNKEDNINIKLHMVGNGDCQEQYVRESNALGLTNRHVFFYGSQYGDELENLYNNADIVINGLAAHRKNIFVDASLKSREGMAKGLPYVTSCSPDLYNDELGKYIHLVSPDESDIDIKGIVDFYHKIYKNPSWDVHNSVRQIAQTYYGWDSAFAEVKNYLLLSNNSDSC